MAGVDATGFTGLTVEEIKDSIETKQLTVVDATLVLSPDQPLAQINGIISEKLAELWEGLGVAYNAFNRGAAEGTLLSNIGDITGTPAEPATKSTVTCTVNLGVSFSQPAGVMTANVAGQPDIKFVNKALVTSTTAGNYTATFEALTYGPTAANAGTLSVITTPVSGWNSITNPEDATLGTLDETDASYRVRQREELSASGSSTPDGLRADVLRVQGVQQAFVFENTTNETDEDGVPAHAINVVIFDGPGADANSTVVAQTIWDNKPSGIQTWGLTYATAIDELGNPQLIGFSRATVKSVWLNFQFVQVDPAFFPQDGIAQIKAAVALRAATILRLGVDVIALQLKGAVLSVPGVVDVPTLFLGFAANPSDTANLVVGSGQIADVDTTNITVSII